MNGGRPVSVVQTDSLPWPWPVPAWGPGLVACSMPTAMTCVGPAAMQEIYRLAYERAAAAARPSRYELALVASRN